MSLKAKAYYFLIGFFCFISHPVFSQDQKLADSLAKIYQARYAGRFSEVRITQKLIF